MVDIDFIKCLLVLIIWSFSATLVSKFTETAHPVIISGIVVSISFVVLLFFMLIRGGLQSLGKYSVKECKKLFIPGLLGIFFYPIFYFCGIKGASPVKANILNYLWPLIAVLYDWIRNKNNSRVGKIERFSFFIAMGGAYIVMMVGYDTGLKFNAFEGKYAVMAFLGALTYGIYTAIIKENIPTVDNSSSLHDNYDDENNKMTNLNRMFIMVLIAFVIHMFVMAYFALFEPEELKNTIQTVSKFDLVTFYLLLYSVLNFTLAHFVWNTINAHNETTYTASMAFLIPFASTILLSKVAGKQIDVSSSVGLFVILIALVLINRESINSINATIFGILTLLIFDVIVPVNNDEELKKTASYFLGIIVPMFAIYYGFVLNRVSSEYNLFENAIDDLHIKKKSKPDIVDIKQLDAQLKQSIKINNNRVYEDLSSHIDDFFCENYDEELMTSYYRFFRYSNRFLSYSEWGIIMLLSVSIIVLCFIVREKGNYVSTISIVSIGGVIFLCASVLYEYWMRKKKRMEYMFEKDI